MTLPRVFVLCCLYEQVIRCADAGADLVRITVQGRREAKACMQIRQKLNEKVYFCVVFYMMYTFGNYYCNTVL